MRPISYIEPADVTAALAAHKGRPEAAYLAGGTTLVDLMKLNVMTPGVLVDVTTLRRRDPALSQISEASDGTLKIGALVSNSALAQHAAVRTRYPVLSEALLAGATVQIRNMATVGGNVLQRTRCYYFRDTAAACNKRELGTGCPALDGYNRLHAILGGSDHCIATHPSDMCVALAALDAVVRVQSSAGERSIPLVDFHTLPRDHPEQETVLAPGEMIIGVDVPSLPFARRRTTSRSAIVPRTPSRWYRSPPHSTSRTARSGPLGSRSAALAPNPGERRRPSKR